MNSIVEDRITGFALFPECENVREEKILSSLKVELLEDGEVIFTETLEGITKEQFERLQSQLLDAVAVNLNLGENWTDSKEISKRNKVLGVVNMFKIEILKEHEDGSKNISIVFLKNGYYASETKFNNVTDKKLEEIRSMLADNMAYNFKCETQSNAVTYLDLIAVMDQKICN